MQLIFRQNDVCVVKHLICIILVNFKMDFIVLVLLRANHLHSRKPHCAAGIKMAWTCFIYRDAMKKMI